MCNKVTAAGVFNGRIVERLSGRICINDGFFPPSNISVDKRKYEEAYDSDGAFGTFCEAVVEEYLLEGDVEDVNIGFSASM
jgi:hypothetical protein